MRFYDGVTLIALAVLVGAVGWFVLGPTQRYPVGGLTTDNIANVVVMTTSATITDGNYDTLQSPQGTAYQVTETRTLLIGSVVGEPLGGVGMAAILELGCGTSAVQDSATPPADPVVLYSITWETNLAPPVERRVYTTCAAGQYPWVHMAGGNYAVSVTGVLR